MKPGRRLLAAALQWAARGSEVPGETARGAALAGIAIGLASAALYWLAVEIWPASIAVALSMLLTAALAVPAGGPAAVRVLALLLKYNGLMALSSATLPFAVPEHVTLCLVLLAGQAASRTLAVSYATAVARPSRMTATDSGVALLLGFAPALLLGVPGLIGLAAAIIVCLGCATRFGGGVRTPAARFDLAQQSTEIAFYLGSLAAWKYIG
jgi:cobalamin synthase